MKHLIRLFVSMLVPALILAFATAAPAMKHEDKAMAAKAEKGTAKITVLAENDKVRVFEVLFKPGDENTRIQSSSHRVVRPLKGGTIMRTYADGKTEKVEWKTGEVGIIGPTGPYTAKNVGKTDVHLYIVQLKQPK